MKKRIINGPTPEVMTMMKRHMSSDGRARLGDSAVASVGLIMVSIPELYFYADLASKSSNVIVAEVFGGCPQHITTLAILGEVSAVRIAIEAIEEAERAEKEVQGLF
ncbi:hypothetical protein A1D22_04375 [Pasteurellaceae bacterium LFhippo2]|nr:hypothetical protein [Pasteurellaceae bacterium LFhippo2]